MIGGPHGQVRIETRSPAQPRVGEIDLLSDPSVGAELRHHAVERPLCAENDLMPLKKPIAGTDRLVPITPAVERLELSVGAEADREEPVQLRAVLLRVVFAESIPSHSAEEPGRVERAPQLRVVGTKANLGNESVVGAELVAEVFVLRVEVPGARRIVVPEVSGMRAKALSVPLGAQLRPVGRAGIAAQKLPGDVLVFGLPLKVGTEHPVVRASADLARCAEKADEGFSEVVAHAADCVRRAKLLIGEVGTERRGKNDQTAAAILGDEQRVGVLAGLAGGTKPPTR